MKVSGWVISMGIGAAVGAVAAMMLPTQSTARKLVNKAADKVEVAANDLSNMVCQKIDRM